LTQWWGDQILSSREGGGAWGGFAGGVGVF